MGELKNRGREQLKEQGDNYKETQEQSESEIEDRDTNVDIINNMEGIDDDDRENIENAKEAGKEIATQIAENIETSKNEVNSRVESTVQEMEGYEATEKDDAGKAASIDGSYSSVGSELESQFEASAEEFAEIASQGQEMQAEYDAKLEADVQNLKMEW